MLLIRSQYPSSTDLKKYSKGIELHSRQSLKQLDCQLAFEHSVSASLHAPILRFGFSQTRLLELPLSQLQSDWSTLAQHVLALREVQSRPSASHSYQPSQFKEKSYSSGNSSSRSKSKSNRQYKGLFRPKHSEFRECCKGRHEDCKLEFHRPPTMPKQFRIRGNERDQSVGSFQQKQETNQSLSTERIKKFQTLDKNIKLLEAQSNKILERIKQTRGDNRIKSSESISQDLELEQQIRKPRQTKEGSRVYQMKGEELDQTNRKIDQIFQRQMNKQELKRAKQVLNVYVGKVAVEGRLKKNQIRTKPLNKKGSMRLQEKTKLTLPTGRMPSSSKEQVVVGTKLDKLCLSSQFKPKPQEGIPRVNTGSVHRFRLQNKRQQSNKLKSQSQNDEEEHADPKTTNYSKFKNIRLKLNLEEQKQVQEQSGQGRQYLKKSEDPKLCHSRKYQPVIQKVIRIPISKRSAGKQSAPLQKQPDSLVLSDSSLGSPEESQFLVQTDINVDTDYISENFNKLSDFRTSTRALNVKPNSFRSGKVSTNLQTKLTLDNFQDFLLQFVQSKKQKALGYQKIMHQTIRPKKTFASSSLQIFNYGGKEANPLKEKTETIIRQKEKIIYLNMNDSKKKQILSSPQQIDQLIKSGKVRAVQSLQQGFSLRNNSNLNFDNEILQREKSNKSGNDIRITEDSKTQLKKLQNKKQLKDQNVQQIKQTVVQNDVQTENKQQKKQKLKEQQGKNIIFNNTGNDQSIFKNEKNKKNEIKPKKQKGKKQKPETEKEYDDQIDKQKIKQQNNIHDKRQLQSVEKPAQRVVNERRSQKQSGSRYEHNLLKEQTQQIQKSSSYVQQQQPNQQTESQNKILQQNKKDSQVSQKIKRNQRTYKELVHSNQQFLFNKKQQQLSDSYFKQKQSQLNSYSQQKQPHQKSYSQQKQPHLNRQTKQKQSHLNKQIKEKQIENKLENALSYQKNGRTPPSIQEMKLQLQKKQKEIKQLDQNQQKQSSKDLRQNNCEQPSKRYSISFQKIEQEAKEINKTYQEKITDQILIKYGHTGGEQQIIKLLKIDESQNPSRYYQKINNNQVLNFQIQTNKQGLQPKHSLPKQEKTEKQANQNRYQAALQQNKAVVYQKKQQTYTKKSVETQGDNKNKQATSLYSIQISHEQQIDQKETNSKPYCVTFGQIKGQQAKMQHVRQQNVTLSLEIPAITKSPQAQNQLNNTQIPKLLINQQTLSENAFQEQIAQTNQALKNQLKQKDKSKNDAELQTEFNLLDPKLLEESIPKIGSSKAVSEVQTDELQSKTVQQTELSVPLKMLKVDQIRHGLNLQHITEKSQNTEPNEQTAEQIAKAAKQPQGVKNQNQPNSESKASENQRQYPPRPPTSNRDSMADSGMKSMRENSTFNVFVRPQQREEGHWFELTSRLSINSTTSMEPKQQDLAALSKGYTYAEIKPYLMNPPANHSQLMGLWDSSFFPSSISRDWKSEINQAWPADYRLLLEIVANLGENYLCRLIENGLAAFPDGSIGVYGSRHGKFQLKALCGRSVSELMFQNIKSINQEADLRQMLRIVLNSPSKVLEVRGRQQKILKILEQAKLNRSSEEHFFGVLRDCEGRADRVYFLLHAESVISNEVSERLIKMRGVCKGQFFMKWDDFEKQFDRIVILNCSPEYYHSYLEVPPSDNPDLRVFSLGLIVKSRAQGVFAIEAVPGFTGKIAVLVYFEIERNKFEFKGRVNGTGELFFLKFYDRGNYLFFIEGLQQNQASHVSFSCKAKSKLKKCQWLQTSKLGYQDLRLLFLPLTEQDLQSDRQNSSRKARSKLKLSRTKSRLQSDQKSSSQL